MNGIRTYQVIYRWRGYCAGTWREVELHLYAWTARDAITQTYVYAQRFAHDRKDERIVIQSVGPIVEGLMSPDKTI